MVSTAKFYTQTSEKDSYVGYSAIQLVTQQIYVEPLLCTRHFASFHDSGVSRRHEMARNKSHQQQSQAVDKMEMIVDN